MGPYSALFVTEGLSHQRPLLLVRDLMKGSGFRCITVWNYREGETCYLSIESALPWARHH